MSRRKRSKTRAITSYLGFEFTNREMAAIDAVVGMTFQNFGATRKQVHSREMFWHLVKIISGHEPKEGELFINSVFRIRLALREMGPIARDLMLARADRKAVANLRNEASADRAKYSHGNKAPRTHVAVGQSKSAPSADEKDEFYKSWKWRTLRTKVLEKFGFACQCCGARPGMVDVGGNPVRIVVDHIKPISKYWNLRLEITNLQVLCDECNMGKGNWNETDFRPAETPDEWVEPPYEDIALEVLASMVPANEVAA